MNRYRIQKQLHADSHKGQASVESLIVLIVLSIIFLFIFTTYTNREIVVSWFAKLLDARRECYKLSELINRVRSNGENFVERVSLNDFTVKVYGNDGWIEVFFDSEYIFCSFSTSNVSFNVAGNGERDFTFTLFGNYKLVNEGTNITFYEI